MAKYTIECPKCGAANTPPSSFKFWQKNMTCACCNHEFNISQSRLICKKCSNPECGKDIIFDQKNPKEKCPYCSTPLKNAATGEYKYEEIICPQCSCSIDIDKNSKVAVCPICDKKIDVPALLAIKKNVTSNGISVIKYEGGNDVFVWKHPQEDFNMGSRLIVHESQEAIFLMGGQLVKTFTRGEYTLDTANLPMMKNVYSTSTNGTSPFHAEIYFVNMTCQMGMKWGIPDPIKILDPKYGVPIEIQAHGEMAIQVVDSKKLLIKLVGTTSGIAWDKSGNDFSKSLRQYFLPQMSPSIVSYITNTISQSDIDIFEISSQYEAMSAGLKAATSHILEEFGLAINRFSIVKLGYNENHPSYKEVFKLRSNTLNLAKVEAEGATLLAEKKAQLDVYKIQAELEKMEQDTKAYKVISDANAEAQGTLLKGTAEADVMNKMGYNQKDVLDAGVRKEFASAMGAAAANGGGGGVMNDLVGLGVALNIGNQMASQAAQMTSGIMNPPQEFTWNCSCGKTGLSEQFCSVCGAPKTSSADTWDCPNCGKKGIKDNFCSGCGTQKPAPEPTWDCPNCGKKGIKDNFCSGCGTQKPVPEPTWDCPNCGKKGLIGKFCSDCGTQKPVSAPTSWTCTACGKTVLNGKFCSTCGAQKPN